MGKSRVWSWFGWRAHQFSARTKAGFLVTGDCRDLIQNRLYWFGVWEPSITAWVSEHLRPGDVVVDVGANIGYYTLLAARLVGPSGHVIAIEPAAEIHARLKQHLDLNRATNVSLIRVAVGAAPGHARLFIGPPHNIGSTSLVDNATTDSVSEHVKVLPLSAILTPELLPRVSLIKIDVEGAEATALSGLEAVMSSLPDRVAIVCEISPERITTLGSSAADLVERMRAFGFSAHRIKNVYGASAYLAQEVRRPELIEGNVDRMVDVVFTRTIPDRR